MDSIVIQISCWDIATHVNFVDTLCFVFPGTSDWESLGLGVHQLDVGSNKALCGFSEFLSKSGQAVPQVPPIVGFYHVSTGRDLQFRSYSTFACCCSQRLLLICASCLASFAWGAPLNDTEICAVGDRWIKTVRRQLSLLRLSLTHRAVEKVRHACFLANVVWVGLG